MPSVPVIRVQPRLLLPAVGDVISRSGQRAAALFGILLALWVLGCTSSPTPQPTEQGPSARVSVLPEPWNASVAQQVVAPLRASVHAPLDCSECHSAGDAARREQTGGGPRVAAVRCERCHAEQGRAFAESVHGRPGRLDPDAATRCWHCHGAHDIERARDPKSRVNRRSLAATCGQCHDLLDTVGAGETRQAGAAGQLRDRIHGQMLWERADAPGCLDCHGTNHGIRAADDARSTVHRRRVTRTCARCHQGEAEAYARGVHGQALGRGSDRPPVCADCHRTHEAPQPQASAKLVATERCSSCHTLQASRYRQSGHGRAVGLGNEAAAACFDCHEAHEVRAASDPESRLSTANRVGTCRQCHPSASRQFAKYLPHADAADPDANLLLFLAFLLVTAVVVGVFGLAALPAVLAAARIVTRGLRRVSARAPPGSPTPGSSLLHPRLRLIDRFCLGWMVLAVLLQAPTGMALEGHPWAQWLLGAAGSVPTLHAVHELGSLGLGAGLLVHLASLIGPLRRRLTVAGRGQRTGRVRQVVAALLGSDSPHLGWGDVHAVRDRVRALWEPRTEAGPSRFSLWEKIAYSGALWAILWMGLSGLALSSPETVSLVCPGWIVNLARLLQGQARWVALVLIPLLYVVMRSAEARLEHNQRAADAQLDEARLGLALTRAPRGNGVAQALFAGLFAALVGLGLACTHLVLSSVRQGRDPALDHVSTLVPGAVSGELDSQSLPGRRVVRALGPNGALLGWILRGEGRGYADQIELLVGLDAPARQLTGVVVLAQKETPGLGDQIAKPDFLNQFVGVSTNVKLDAQLAPTNQVTGTVRAVTGATISSDAVCTIINETVGAAKDALAAAAQQAGP
jgi:hypothetical protein